MECVKLVIEYCRRNRISDGSHVFIIETECVKVVIEYCYRNKICKDSLSMLL